MPSFDIVSEVDLQEIRNAVDQSNREVGQRFDFKGADAEFTINDQEILLESESEFQLDQMRAVLELKLAKRKIDTGALEVVAPELSNRRARQRVIVRQGVDTDTARRLVKDIKASKIKAQAQIQGEQVRVSGKKRDDLQRIIGLVQDGDYGLPLQFVNFRD